mgnify:FL=1
MMAQNRGLSVDFDDQASSSYNNSTNSIHSNQSNSPRHARLRSTPPPPQSNVPTPQVFILFI